MSNTCSASRDTKQIRDWKSIVVLIVFVVANLIVLFPHHIPFPVPRILYELFLDLLVRLRVFPAKRRSDEDGEEKGKKIKILWFPMNMVTGPLISVLFLLAITAIGREEVKSGTVGADNIDPIDIMAFFFTLAYIAISIDASGLIRWLAFKVLQKGGNRGRRLYFYLYCFFFALSCCIGNDPVILSGTAFLAYMFRISGNIENPKAWIHAQFAAANMGSAVLVTSNPTNLVLAGAFDIKFIHYTANMIVPVLATVLVLFPFLLWAVFSKKDIPAEINLRAMPAGYDPEERPVNPNIPNARAQEKDFHETDEGKDMLIAEIMNPFLDRKSAAFGAFIMAATLITILVENAASNASKEHPVFWVTLPAACVMLVWDLWMGYIHREETRTIARKGREEMARLEFENNRTDEKLEELTTSVANMKEYNIEGSPLHSTVSPEQVGPNEKATVETVAVSPSSTGQPDKSLFREPEEKTTLQSLVVRAYRSSQETFPTSTVVLTHLPFALVPFALCMFVLVQALVSKGWVPVFAFGWKHWVDKTGTIGAIGGMAFLSVVLCNFAGTNIGTTILLSRVIQDWWCISNPGEGISQRTFWATVYSMALGVNFGAFSTALSASLAGLLWRDILGRKFIPIRSVDFARINLPIIAIAMVIGCVVLIGEVYITRSATDLYYGWQATNSTA